MSGLFSSSSTSLDLSIKSLFSQSFGVAMEVLSFCRSPSVLKFSGMHEMPFPALPYSPFLHSSIAYTSILRLDTFIRRYSLLDSLSNACYCSFHKTIGMDEEIIEGLKEVLVGMRVGGKRRALIPPSVGYINENLNPIPEEFGPRRSLLSHRNEPLIFEVQLLKWGSLLVSHEVGLKKVEMIVAFDATLQIPLCEAQFLGGTKLWQDTIGLIA
uniref:peptidylprolyl isomerase n=1 Tax=Cucumis melo TaxID=3656 RepID=A0A9I9E543_CUCME